MLNVRTLFVLLLVVSALGVFTSCGRKPPPPRTRDEIFRDRVSLPAVYLTVKTHTRVLAPGGKGAFIDQETGELCWPALACTNPNCPGKGKDEPYLFIDPDPGVFVKPDGTLGYDLAMAKASKADGTCPKCAANRNFANETNEDRQRYINWVRPYVLPETAQRQKALDEELQKRIIYERTLLKAPELEKKRSAD